VRKNLFIYFYDEPNLIKDILSHLCELWISIAEELTSKIEFDIAVFWEDMSGKQGSLISPVTFREFMSPLYKKLIVFLKSKKIKYFNVDSDGYVGQLIPLFLEAGINSMYPFEQQAGNDLIEIRKKFPDLRMLGGFDKNSLYKGKEYIDKELEKMAFLIRQGGYIPYADHLIPPNCSWENFKYYREKLRKIIDSTKVLD
jgi:uroporphyrinogen-III decarboxylase